MPIKAHDLKVTATGEKITRMNLGKHNVSEIRRRNHRLELSLYLGRQAVAFTICTANKSDYFSSSPTVKMAQRALHAVFRTDRAAVVYCFMPDHLHLITIGERDEFSPLQAVKVFKQKVVHDSAELNKPFFWQRSFYDHVIRSDENLNVQIAYLLDNPVRKNLVKRWEDWPGNGFIGHSLYFPQ